MQYIRFFLLAFLFIFYATPIFSDLSPLEKMQEINSNIEKNKKKIKAKLIEKNIAEQNLSILSRELRFTELELDKAHRSLVHAKSEEKKNLNKLFFLKDRFQKKRRIFERRLVELYKNKNSEVMDLIFSNADFILSTEGNYFLDKIIQADSKLIEAIKIESHVVNRQKEKWQQQATQVSKLKEEISAKEKQLEERRSMQTQYIQTLTSQIQDMERKNKDLEKASDSLASLIRKQGAGKNINYATGKMMKPSSGWFSSGFGIRFHPIFKKRIMHRGIDLASPVGTPIYAADSGVVLVAGDKAIYRGYGVVTVIDHGKQRNGTRLSTVYAHQSRLLIKEGDFVKKGQHIGFVGNTGYSTGPHLHFEVREDGVPVNPLKYLQL